MPLVVPPPPQESVQVLRSGLAVLTQRGEFSRVIRRARPEQLNATLSHAVYTAPLSVAAEGSLEQSTLTGWRYLIRAGDDVVASAETMLRDDGTYVFAEVNYGPFVRGTLDAITVAERAVEGTPEPYELRLLNIPAIYLMAVWLVAVDSERSSSSYIPSAPAPDTLEANRVYEEGEWITAIQRLAAAVPALEPNDPLGG